MPIPLNSTAVNSHSGILSVTLASTGCGECLVCAIAAPAPEDHQALCALQRASDRHRQDLMASVWAHAMDEDAWVAGRAIVHGMAPVVQASNWPQPLPRWVPPRARVEASVQVGGAGAGAMLRQAWGEQPGHAALWDDIEVQGREFRQRLWRMLGEAPLRARSKIALALVVEVLASPLA
jgi:hypothetical protein